jgi:hypothetical protein
MNKYKKWYDTIVQRGQSRILESTVYSETHHIIPRSLGGSDDLANLTVLTAREHFICHWLLVKMHTGHNRHQMLNALRMMRAENNHHLRYHTKITARVYANLKEEYAKLQSIKFTGEGNGMYGKTHSKEAKDKIRQANLGNQINEEQRKKISDSKLGRTRDPFSNEWKENLSKNHKSKNPNYNTAHSEETRKKIGDKLRGKKQDPERVAARAEKQRSLKMKREKLLCPHCNQLISVNTYPRWHGDNCKNNT